LEPKDVDLQVTYINTHNEGALESYKAEKFESDFIASGRYRLLTKNRKFMDPFKNDELGKKGTPSAEEGKMASYRRAVKMAKEKNDAIGGGFDIVRKLFYKQHKKQKKPPK
jgi:hypothetical protein